MRKLALVMLAFAFAVVSMSEMAAQDTAKPKKDYSDSTIVTKMMAFNKKKDGKLTKEEVTDPRLRRLFDLADTNKDGVVTRDELMALAAKMDKEWGEGGGKGGKGDKGFKGKGPPPVGLVLPPFIADQLELTADQKKLVQDLQKEVDGRLQKILTETQKEQLKDFQKKGGPKGPPPPP